jgi:hypothetical protein
MPVSDASAHSPDEAVREELRQQLAAKAQQEAEKLPPEKVDRDPAAGPLGLQVPVPRPLDRLARFLAGRRR